MLKQLFVNAATLIASLFIMGQYFTSTPLNHRSPLKYRLIAGGAAGLVGSILVTLSVHITESVVVDFRYLSLAVAAMFGGPLSAIVGAIIIAAFRIVYMGVSYTSVKAAIFVFTAAFGCGIISKLRCGRKNRWRLMFTFCVVNTFMVLFVLLNDLTKLINAFIPYTVAFSFLSYLVYYYAENIALSNELLRKLKQESSKDFLTGLNNVRSFDRLYNSALENAQEKSEELSVVIIDIDHFKKVNDKYGHPAGDAVLKQLGELIQGSCRSFDIVSRNGGEEFSAILLDCSCQRAIEISERIRKTVQGRKFVLPDGREINITISLGIATYPDVAQDNESLFKNADKALYKAKNGGRNKVCYFNGAAMIACDRQE